MSSFLLTARPVTFSCDNGKSITCDNDDQVRTDPISGGKVTLCFNGGLSKQDCACKYTTSACGTTNSDNGEDNKGILEDNFGLSIIETEFGTLIENFFTMIFGDNTK